MQYILKGYEQTAKSLGFNKKSISNYTNKIIDYSIKNISTGVVEEAPNGSLIQYDIYTRLLKDRVMFIGHPIMDEVTNIAIAQLLFMEMTDSKKDVTLYINSPGGSVSAGLSLINVMDYVAPDISVTSVGLAASMGAVIVACGAKGKRYSLKDAKYMIHQVSGGGSGKSTDLEITLEEMKKTRKRLYELLAEKSGKTYKQINDMCKDDCWMTAEEAKKEGFIDHILNKRGEKH